MGDFAESSAGCNDSFLQYKRHLQARVKQGKSSASELKCVAHRRPSREDKKGGGEEPAKPDGQRQWRYNKRKRKRLKDR